MYIRDGNNYIVTASNGGADRHSGWFANLQASPQTSIEVDGMTRTVIAHKASKEENGRLWPRLVDQAPFFEGYTKKTTRDIPMIILQPFTENSLHHRHGDQTKDHINQGWFFSSVRHTEARVRPIGTESR
jgi:deazaflavin-dependent oxidoreductase (nitroreductase family)